MKLIVISLIKSRIFIKFGADVHHLPKCHCDYSLERSRLTFKVICFMYDSTTTVMTRRKHCTNGKSTEECFGLDTVLSCLDLVLNPAVLFSLIDPDVYWYKYHAHTVVWEL